MKEEITINGKTYIVEHAKRSDVALCDLCAFSLMRTGCSDGAGEPLCAKYDTIRKNGARKMDAYFIKKGE